MIVPLPDPSGPPAYFLIQAFERGAPGKTELTVLNIPGSPQDSLMECNDGPSQYFNPNDMVITLEDLSVLYAELDPDGGWVCFQ